MAPRCDTNSDALFKSAQVGGGWVGHILPTPSPTIFHLYPFTRTRPHNLYNMQFYLLHCLLPKAGLSQFGQIFEKLSAPEKISPRIFTSPYKPFTPAHLAGGQLYMYV